MVKAVFHGYVYKQFLNTCRSPSSLFCCLSISSSAANLDKGEENKISLEDRTPVVLDSILDYNSGTRFEEQYDFSDVF